MDREPKPEHDTFDEFMELERDASKSTLLASWQKPSAMSCQTSPRRS
jgi:hypothetical protein